MRYLSEEEITPHEIRARLEDGTLEAWRTDPMGRLWFREVVDGDHESESNFLDDDDDDDEPVNAAPPAVRILGVPPGTMPSAAARIKKRLRTIFGMREND